VHLVGGIAAARRASSRALARREIRNRANQELRIILAIADNGLATQL
jgi:hypothetical protein